MKDIISIAKKIKQAGGRLFLVGGAVRDSILGNTTHDEDYCVTGLNEEDFESKLSQIIDIAIKECERMYPIFKVVLTKGMEPRQALYPMMMETVGQA